VADQFGAGGDFTVGHLGRDCIGILDGDGGKGHGQLNRLFASLFRGHQDVGGLSAVGIG
jgi:hypothetical protein